MKIYLSGKYQQKNEIKQLKRLLKQNGFKVVSNWEHNKNYKKLPKKKQRIQAKNDIQKIKQSDIFIMLYNGIKGSGMFFELGFAYAKHKKIIILNKTKDENISQFLSLKSIKIINSENELLQKLNK